MTDTLQADAQRLSRDPTIAAILVEVCERLDMAFAAVARVTRDRWIACQVLDKAGFGIGDGDELHVETTICGDIRETFRGVIIDDASTDERWLTHPTPILYGFRSYISIPIILSDGAFFGTLFAIDPQPRRIEGDREVLTMMRYLAHCVGRICEGKPIEPA